MNGGFDLLKTKVFLVLKGVLACAKKFRFEQVKTSIQNQKKLFSEQVKTSIHNFFSTSQLLDVNRAAEKTEISPPEVDRREMPPKRKVDQDEGGEVKDELQPLTLKEEPDERGRAVNDARKAMNEKSGGGCSSSSNM